MGLQLQHIWRSLNPLSLLLMPLSLLFCLLVAIRKALYRWGLLRSSTVSLPVIIVGNISVGGTGKTPFVIWLTGFLQSLGYRPGIISRGYGGTAGKGPLWVTTESDPQQVGDEPLLLVRRTGCPVVVGSDRVSDCRTLIEKDCCNIIIADDGLQHYALQRDIEIALVDVKRGLGNGLCLPAGPLREPRHRLKTVDFVVSNGMGQGIDEHSMVLQPRQLFNLLDKDKKSDLVDWQSREVHAVAGIGDPQRFFDTLRAAGIRVIEHPFPDHHPFNADDFYPMGEAPVLMSEKDAVKCTQFAKANHWYLTVDAQLDSGFAEKLQQRLRGPVNG